jgi:phenylalanyl-tRNA synthetase alpha chain
MPTPDLDAVVAVGRRAIAGAADLEELREAEQAHLSKRSALGEVQRSLGGLDTDARRELGRLVNQARTTLQAELAARRAELEAERDAALLEAERVDVSLPGRVPPRGAIHPVTRTIDEIVDIFIGLGYRVVEGPEVETDWYNFQALNIPPDHPARSMQDTLYIESGDGRAAGELVLRTQTSPVQIRAMQAGPPPVYVVAPGRCYRADTPDATHVPVFNQIEVLAVDRGLTMADMKGTLLAFARAYFGEDRQIRLRPSYFPFVEPGAEVDVSCFICGGTGAAPGTVGATTSNRAASTSAREASVGAGCRTCRGEGWIELLGAGMVHPNVLRAGGYDPDEVSGFAAGTGIERPFMLRSGLADMRTLTDNDVRWLTSV